MIKKILIVNFLVLFVLNTRAQEVQDIVIGGRLCCNLHEALHTISSEHDVVFEYDEELLSKMEYKSFAVNKPLFTFILEICRKYDLNYKMNLGSNVVKIIAHPKAIEDVENQQEPYVKPVKAYFGPPKSFNLTISGRVVDFSTGEALPFVSIVAKNANIGTTSNVDGFFTLFDVPSDTTTIQLSYMGYQGTEVFLSPNVNTEQLFVEMASQSVGLNELVVTATREDVLQVNREQTSVIKMSPQQLSSLPNLGEKDILRSFQLMPGISAANENSSGLYVRGGTPDQVLVLYDGFTVYNVEHLFGFFSAFNSNSIKDVQLYKGGFDAQYGGRLSSVLDIVGKEGNQNEFNATADVSLMSVNGMVEFPLGKKTSVLLAGRRSWRSPIYNKIFDQFVDENEGGDVAGGMGRPGGNGMTTEQETISYFYDLNGKVTYRPSDKDVVALSVYNGKDDLDNSVSPSSSTGGGFGGGFDMDMETTDITKWGNTGASLKWSRQHNAQLYSNALLSYSNYYSNRNRATEGNFMREEGSATTFSDNMMEDNNLIDITGKIDFEYQLSQNQKWGFGVQMTYNDIDYSYLQNDTISVIDRSSQGEIYAAYLEDRISFSDNKLIVTPGLRYSYFTGTDKSYFEPRLNAVYNLTDKLRFKGATGQYYQFAKRVIREDISEGSRDFWVLSDNENLPVSSSLQFIAGAAYETSNYLFDVEGFYKILDNVTEYSLRIDAGRRDIGYEENFFTGTGLAKGVDFLVQKTQGVVTGWVGYTLSQVTNRIEEFGDYDFYASHDVTHEFKSVLSYRWRSWDFGATWIYASGKPYTSPEGGYELTLLDGSTADYINVSVKNGNRLPDYHRFDLSASYNFKLGQSSPATLSFSAFNVYNRANVWYKEYEIVDNEVIETPVYYLGFTPNVSLSIKLK